MSKEKALVKTTSVKNVLDVQFANEFIIGLDFNVNLHPNAKEEIRRVREFYANTL